MHQFLNIIDIIEHKQTIQIIQNIYFIIWSVQIQKTIYILQIHNIHKNIYIFSQWVEYSP
jgi:hypothetical protein